MTKKCPFVNSKYGNFQKKVLNLKPKDTQEVFHMCECMSKVIWHSNHLKQNWHQREQFFLHTKQLMFIQRFFFSLFISVFTMQSLWLIVEFIDIRFYIWQSPFKPPLLFCICEVYWIMCFPILILVFMIWDN